MLTNPQRIELIHQRLQTHLTITHLNVIDDSHKHIGHAGAKSGAGHFTVEIGADEFCAKSLIDCHRLIYAAVGDAIGPEIHALAIKVLR